MPYIGRGTDKLSNVEVLDNITFDGSSSYTLQKGGVNFTPSSANNILISIDGVVQAGNFTVSSSTIDFGTAVAGTSTCDFILHYGVGLITTPADGTVTTAKLADSSVSLAKLTATGTKDSTTFLRGDNTFSALPASGITMADQWRLNAHDTVDSSETDLDTGWEQVDTTGFGTIGSAMTQSSGVFTFPSTGIYFVHFEICYYANTGADYTRAVIKHYDGSSTYTTMSDVRGFMMTSQDHLEQCAVLFDCQNTATDKIIFYGGGNVANLILGNTSSNKTNVTFIRLGDT